MIHSSPPTHFDTLSPLPGQVRHWLIAISVVNILSFVSTTFLSAYLIYKLAAWRLLVHRRRKRDGTTRWTGRKWGRTSKGQAQTQEQYAVDMAMDADVIFTGEQMPSSTYSQHLSNSTNTKFDDATTFNTIASDHSRSNTQPSSTSPSTSSTTHPNQFLILILNLFLADTHLSIAFLINFFWLRSDSIRVGTAACFTQGLLISIGGLAPSMFILLIATHTYLTVVRGWTPPQKWVYAAVVATWALVYGVSLIPIAATRNGAAKGGFFVRSEAWCWITKDYDDLQLWTHFIFMYISLIFTSLLYICISVKLRQQFKSRQREALSYSSPFNGTSTSTSSTVKPNTTYNKDSSRADNINHTHSPVFLIYPIIYVICTTPILIARIITMSGHQVSTNYLCFSGAIIAAGGFLDCLVFGTTRHVIVFGSKFDVDDEGMGLDTFAFMQTPKGRRYGNFVWIQGGNGPASSQKGGSSLDGHGNSNTDAMLEEGRSAGGWWSKSRLTHRSNTDERHVVEAQQHHHHHGNNSQEALRYPPIQMNTVTSVEVEDDPNMTMNMNMDQLCGSLGSKGSSLLSEDLHCSSAF